MGTEEKEIEEWLNNIRIGDTVYALSTEITRVKTSATVKDILIQKSDKGTRYTILCNVLNKEIRIPIAFRCRKCVNDAHGKYMDVYDGCVGFYILFTSEEACNRYIEREKVYFTVHSFLTGGECLVKRGKNDTEKPKTFSLSDYSLEDMQRIADVLGILKTPDHIACMYGE